PTVTNCILWGNVPNEIADDVGSSTTASYSDIAGGFPGVGNIDADPLFVDPDNGNLRLQPGSPCIDAANNNAVLNGIETDLDGNSRFIEVPSTPDTGLGDCPIVDMGAYEFQEGKANCCPWDLDESGSVGTSDLLALFAQWGTDGPADFDGSGTVNTNDLLILFANWGPCP
ncbi:MAG: hypothetical protein IH984_00005, partial [Planctomycetes bacterium]|nr:hypothetical protein [Planctomycetota bacterium]